MSAARWYVVQTRPHAEVKAQEHLRRQGFTTYLPQFIKLRRHARKTERVCRPLFPRYMFVLIDTTRQSCHSIRSTVGVSSLVGGETGPVAVQEGVIDALRAREDTDGYVRQDSPRLLRGTAVRVLDGVFATCLGVFEYMSDKERVAVLLEFLGRPVRVVLDAESITGA